MQDWVVWLVFAGGLLVAELFTLTFVLGLLSAAAVVTAGVAALGAPLAVEIAAFAGTSALGYVLVRPFERLHQSAPAIATGTAALTGRRAVVVEEVGAGGGRVSLGGESWLARPLVPSAVPLPVGASVVVSAVDGATVVVYSEEL